jgi:ornithine carbamoyltransferase
MPHFLDLATATPAGLRAILDDAHARKAARAGWPKGQMDADAPLAGHVLGMIFEKPSTRTRFSFDMGARQLGATTIVSSAGEMQLGRGETVADTARVLSRMVDALMLRTNNHEKLEQLAEHATIPVINGLSDFVHPCQALSDFFTLTEKWGTVKGRTLTYVGDGNNTCHALIHTAVKLGANIRVCSPEGYEPNSRVVTEAMRTAQETGSELTITNDPDAAADGADAIYTDVWASMGQEDEIEDRNGIFAAYQVDDEMMRRANKGALFMHCLPAHRGWEVTQEVMDGPQSVVYDIAENRLHVQKAVLALLMR